MSHNIPNSDTNPNPNPSFEIAQNPRPSFPIPPEINTRNIKIKSRNPNWLNLPEEIWFLILSRLYTIHIIENVQKVCKLFRKICVQPSMFTIIDMSLHSYRWNLKFDVKKMTRYAVDRSDGGLIDVYVEYVCDDDTLMYIVERSKKLKHLRIGHRPHISFNGLIQALQLYQTIDELELIICNIPHSIIKTIGSIYPSLKSFSLNKVGSKHYNYSNDEALAIAGSMPNLHRLQVIGNKMTNYGLNAILIGCPHLQTLDIRACFYVRLILDSELSGMCDGIKDFKGRNDATADYKQKAVRDSGIDSYWDEFTDWDVSDTDSEEGYNDVVGPGFLDSSKVRVKRRSLAYIDDCALEGDGFKSEPEYSESDFVSDHATDFGSDSN